MIRIVPNFNKADIQKMLEQKREAWRQAMIFRLKRIGEQFIKNARENGTYKDRTGNLRNSAGYVILVDGEQLFENFIGDKSEARQKATEAIEVAKEEITKGIALIVVAGMEYAAAVEALGFDVLTASGKIAEKNLRDAIKTISSKISKAA